MKIIVFVKFECKMNVCFWTWKRIFVFKVVLITLFFIKFNHTTFPWIIKERKRSIHWNCSLNGVVSAIYSCLLDPCQRLIINHWKHLVFAKTSLPLLSSDWNTGLLNTARFTLVLFTRGIILCLHLSTSVSLAECCRD